MILLILLISLWQNENLGSYICTHDINRNDIEKLNITMDYSKSKRLRMSLIDRIPRPLIIHFEYDKSFNKLPFSDIIEREVYEVVQQEFSQILQVKYPVRPLLLRRQCKDQIAVRLKSHKIQCLHGCVETKCLSLVISDRFLAACTANNYSQSNRDGRGIDADIIVFVTSISCESQEKSWTSICKMDDLTDRPIAAIHNICKNTYSHHIRRRIIEFVKHEMIHIFGFDEVLFAYFRDSDNKPITPRDKYGYPSLGYEYKRYNFPSSIAKKKDFIRHSLNKKQIIKIWVFTMPLTVNEYSAHLKIPKTVVPLEDHYPSLSGMNSHFDELALGNELMTSIIDGSEKLSRITLAFLEDTGWYIANYSHAEYLEYGKNFEFDIFKFGCYLTMNELKKRKQSIYPFCETRRGYTLRCPVDRSYVNQCNIVHTPNLSKKFQHLDKIYGLKSHEKPEEFSGLWLSSEHCPMYTVWTFDDNSKVICNNKAMSNFKANNKHYLPNYFGDDSICVEMSYTRYLIKESSNWNGSYGAGCLRYFCDMQRNTLIIYNGNLSIAYCKNIPIEHKFSDGRIEGKIICPIFANVCSNDKSKSLTNVNSKNNKFVTRGLTLKFELEMIIGMNALALINAYFYL